MEDMNPNAVALALKVARRSGAITEVEIRRNYRSGDTVKED